MFGLKKRYILKVWREMREQHSREDCFESLDDFCNEAAESQGVEAREVFEWVTEFEALHGMELDLEFDLDCMQKPEKVSKSQTAVVRYSPGKSSITPRVTPTSSTVTPTPNLLYQSDKLIEEISNFPANLLIATRPGAGKSTLLNAIIHSIISRQDDSELQIIDPKTNRWLGLERSLQIVTYISSDIKKLEQQINKASAVLKQRVDARQSALQAGKRVPKFPHYYLIIDEWFSLFGCDLEGDKKHPILLKLKDICVRGRELFVHVILVSQSHQVDEIGFSRALREAFDIICLGSTSSSFEPLYKAANDNNLYSNAKQREGLNQAIEQGIQQCKRNRLALVSLGGQPRVTILPDLSSYNKVTVELPDELLQPLPDNITDELPNFPTSTTRKGGKNPSFGAEVGGSGSGSLSNDGNVRRIYKLVALLSEAGITDTQIVERGFECRGRKFIPGMEALQEIRDRGARNGW